MDFLKSIWAEITGFFGFGNLIDIIKAGDYKELLTYHGITSVLGPLIPFILVVEIIRAAFYKRFKVIDYKISFFTYVLNAFVGRVISFAMVGLCIGFFAKYAILNLLSPGIGLFMPISFGSFRILFITFWRTKYGSCGACIPHIMRRPI